MDRADSIRRAQPLLGTFVEIAAAGAPSSDLDTAVDAAFGAVAQVHRLMSIHDAQSELSGLNGETSTRPVTVHAWTYQVLEAARELHARSGGVFDIGLSPLLSGGCASERASEYAPFPFDLLARHRVRRCGPHRPVDLGGIAKGFAVDCALDVLRAHGVARGMVNAGGDLAVFGPWPESIHVRDPQQPSRLIARLELANAALASSGRGFDPLQTGDVVDAAVIDPRTRKPVRAVVGATVRAPSCMTADALTKLVMIQGEDAAEVLQHYCANALMVLESGDVRITSDWQCAIRPAA